MPIRRRDLLKWLGLGGGAGLVGAAGTAAAGRPQQGPPASPPYPAAGHGHGTATGGPGGLSGRYARISSPPPHLGPRALDALCVPQPFRPAAADRPREVELRLVETLLEVGHGAVVQAVAYDGTVPGPIVRARVGEELAVSLVNQTGAPHTLHFHGAFDPTQDGWQPVPPGERRTYRIRPDAVGLHPYHCHTAPYAWHIAKGMYGAMIVDPPGGRPPAHEFVLVLSGWDLDGDGRNEIYAWNGVAGFYDRFPIKVPAGERVRFYVANLVEYDPVASFHLHAHTFDVFRGSSLVPSDHTDVVSLGPTERVILEFTLPRRGRYMFHPHQGQMIEGGAMGWIVAI